MNGLALCSGFGGIELGLESRIDGYRTVCHVEGEAYAAAVLVKKIQEGTIHEAAVWSNVKTFNGEPWRSKVDIITGGFPCQPHSSAGKLLGEEDPRNLWPDVKRIISEVRPRILFLENVSNINNTIAPSIVGDLAEMGYDAAWCVVRASDVGAPHRRSRWFIMAKILRHPYSNGFCEHADEESGERIIKKRELARHRFENISHFNSDSYGERRNKDELNVSNTNCQRTERRRFELRPWPLFKRYIDQESIEPRRFEEWWAVEPRVGRMVDGVANWVDRLRGCGNGVVPQQAAYAFDILSSALFNNMEEKT